MRNPAGRIFEKAEVWEETLAEVLFEDGYVPRYFKKVIKEKCIDLYDSFIFNSRKKNLIFNGKRYESYGDLKKTYN